MAEGLLGQVTFNFDEADVTQGFRSTAYDFGLLRAGGGAKTQDFDDYRLYNAVPAEFAAIPEPAGVALIGVAAAAVLARRRRER